METTRVALPAARATAIVAFAAALAIPGAAAARTTVVAGPTPLTYLNAEVELQAGQPLGFMNLDLAGRHDVTSTETGRGAQPLFRSDTVGFGSTVPVAGAETLGPGSYPFVCSVHGFMRGTLTVTGAPPGGADEKAPRTSLRPLDSRLERVVRRGALRLRVRSSEAAVVRLRAKARVDSRRVTIAAGRERVKRGASKLRLDLTARGERVLRGRERAGVAVAARARDEAGNSRTTRVSFTLR